MRGVTMPMPLEVQSLIPKFDGNTKVLKLFLRQCDYVAESYSGDKIENLYLFHVICSKLTGNAASLVSELEDLATWKQLKEVLIENFGDQRTQECMAVELDSLKISYGETFMNFCNRIKSIRRSLFSKLNEIQDDNLKKIKTEEYNKMAFNVFLFNLPQELVQIVRIKGATTLEEALMIVQEEVDFMYGYHHHNKMPHSFNPQNPFAGYNWSPGYKFGSHCSNGPQRNTSYMGQNVGQAFGAPSQQGTLFGAPLNQPSTLKFGSASVQPVNSKPPQSQTGLFGSKPEGTAFGSSNTVTVANSVKDHSNKP